MTRKLSGKCLQMEISVREIIDITGGEYSGEDDVSFRKISINSREISPGDMFIALKGDKFDGHDFLQEAYSKGAAGFMVKAGAAIPSRLLAKTVIQVPDTIKAMSRIAAYFRRKTSAPVICITGTNGKTTVKDLLAHILSFSKKVLKCRKSYNNVIGLSLTLFRLEQDHEAVVLEAGTNHPGEMRELVRIAAPERVVITNVGDGHLEAFTDKYGVLKEKVTILEGLKEGGKAYVNGDDPLLVDELYGKKNVIFFGKSSGCGVKIASPVSTDKGYDVSVGGYIYSVPIKGRHNIYNAASAIAVALDMGLSPGEVARSLSGFKLPSMRLERHELDSVTFINDAYNANPTSFNSALDALDEEKGSSLRIVVAGQMLELGPRSGEFHRELGKNIAGRGIDYLVAMGDFADDVVKGASTGGMDGERIFVAATHTDAASFLTKIPGKSKIILLKGSRNSKMEEVLKCFTTSCTL